MMARVIFSTLLILASTSCGLAISTDRLARRGLRASNETADSNATGTANSTSSEDSTANGTANSTSSDPDQSAPTETVNDASSQIPAELTENGNISMIAKKLKSVGNVSADLSQVMSNITKLLIGGNHTQKANASSNSSSNSSGSAGSNSSSNSSSNASANQSENASTAYQPLEMNTLKYLGIAAAAAKRGAENLLPYSMGPDPAPLTKMRLDKVWDLDGSDVPALPSFLQQDQTAHRALRLRGSGAAASSGRAISTDNNEIVLQVVQKPGASPTPVRIKLHPEWAPIGVAQLQQLVANHYMDGAAFFRVVPGFIAQFGLPAKPMPKWAPLQDDPVAVTNSRGTVTFATSGPNSRTNQLFINLGNNANLDARGFSPIGEIVEGMPAVDAINSEYGENPNQGSITALGNMYLDQQFPRLSKIQAASLR